MPTKLHSQDRSIARQAAGSTKEAAGRHALSRPRAVSPEPLSEHDPIAHQEDVNVFTDARAFALT
jgi:hypothetical protein